MNNNYCKALFIVLCVSVMALGNLTHAQGIFDNSQDIGPVATAGGANVNGDNYTLSGNGTGIGGTSDQCHYVYKEISGSFRLSANAYPFPAAGTETSTQVMIMIRQDLTPESAYYGPQLDGNLGISTQARSSAGNNTTSIGGPADTLGDFEVVRVNGELKSYYLDDVGDRILLDSRADFLVDPVYVGFAISSGATDGSLSEADIMAVVETPIQFGLSRDLPSFTFVPGETLDGIVVNAKIDDGASIDMVVTEVLPEGWTVVNPVASLGSTAIDGDGNLVWTANGATGNSTLTYSLDPPADAGIRGFLSGSGTDGASVLNMGSGLLLAEGQLVLCRKFANGVSITIDGDSSDWPLTAFDNPALMPDIDPSEQFANTASTNALDLVPIVQGDHYEYNPDKILARSGAETSFETAEDDLDSTVYIAWDDDGFYVLNIIADSQIGLEHGNGGNPTDSWELDGISLWFDTDNNRMPPNINTDPTSPFDLQLDYSIGAPLWAEERPGEDIPVNLEINTFRSALNSDDEVETAMLDSIQRVTVLDNNPTGEHKGYVQEMFFPWGVFPSFQPDEPIGFNILWNDYDDTVFGLYRWHQSVESDISSVRALQFVSDDPLGEVSPVRDWSLF
jgi:hypothetical protein